LIGHPDPDVDLRKSWCQPAPSAVMKRRRKKRMKKKVGHLSGY
jgi:hypothetical protein